MEKVEHGVMMIQLLLCLFQGLVFPRLVFGEYSRKS